MTEVVVLGESTLGEFFQQGWCTRNMIGEKICERTVTFNDISALIMRLESDENMDEEWDEFSEDNGNTKLYSPVFVNRLKELISNNGSQN